MSEHSHRETLHIEAAVNPPNDKGILRRFCVMDGDTQVSTVPPKDCKESVQIPRLLLILLYWKMNGQTCFSKQQWRHLYDVVQKSHATVAPFVKAELVVADDGFVVVREERFSKDRVDIKLSLNGAPAIDGLVAIKELEELLRCASSPAGLGVSDPQIATALGNQLLLPHAGPVTNLLLGKAVWLSRISELHLVFHPEHGVFQQLHDALAEDPAPVPQDVESWVGKATCAGRTLRLRMNGGLLKTPLKELHSILVAVIGEVEAYIAEGSKVPAADWQKPAFREQRRTLADALAKRVFTTERGSRMQFLFAGLALQVAQCRGNLHRLLDELRLEPGQEKVNNKK